MVIRFDVWSKYRERYRGIRSDHGTRKPGFRGWPRRFSGGAILTTIAMPNVRRLAHQRFGKEARCWSRYRCRFCRGIGRWPIQNSPNRRRMRRRTRTCSFLSTKVWIVVSRSTDSPSDRYGPPGLANSSISCVPFWDVTVYVISSRLIFQRTARSACDPSPQPQSAEQSPLKGVGTLAGLGFSCRLLLWLLIHVATACTVTLPHPGRLPRSL